MSVLLLVEFFREFIQQPQHQVDKTHQKPPKLYIRLNILNNKQKKKYMNKKNIMLNVVASRFSNIKEKKKIPDQAEDNALWTAAFPVDHTTQNFL